MKLANPEHSKLFKVGESGTMLVYPNIEGMMTGVTYIFHNHPRYLICYTDNTAEEAVIDDESLKAETNLFTLVDRIQTASREG